MITQVLLAAGAVVVALVAYYVGVKIGMYREKVKRDEIIDEERQKAVDKSRAVLKGKISEQIVPLRDDFPYQMSEMTFLGDPIDFLVFKGREEDAIEEVVFLEVKTGESGLTSAERELKKTIQDGSVTWKEYRVD